MNTAWRVADTAVGCTPLAGPYKWMFHRSKTSLSAPPAAPPPPEVTHSKIPSPPFPGAGVTPICRHRSLMLFAI